MPTRVGVVGVIPGNSTLVATLAERDGLRIPLLCDPEYQWHQWLGLGRFGLAEFFKPTTIARYIRGLLKGRMTAKAGENADLMRQGGEVLVSENGQPLWVHRSENPTDRPTTLVLSQVVRPIN